VPKESIRLFGWFHRNAHEIVLNTAPCDGIPFVPKDKAERMAIEQIRAEIEPMGFEIDRELDFLPIQHSLILTKRP
jgi:hypothetical protein